MNLKVNISHNVDSKHSTETRNKKRYLETLKCYINEFFMSNLKIYFVNMCFQTIFLFRISVISKI